MTEFAAPPTNTSSFGIPSPSTHNLNPFVLTSSNGVRSPANPSRSAVALLSSPKPTSNGTSGHANGNSLLKGKARDLTGFKGKTLELLQNPFVWVDFVDPDKEADDELDGIPAVDQNCKKRKHQEDPEAGPSNSSYSYDGIGPRLPMNGHASSSSTSSPDEIIYPHDPRITRPANVTRNQPYGIGLINLGNTCYQNSVIQILMHTPPVMEFLSKHEETKVCPDFCLACNLKTTMNGMWTGKRRGAISMREMNRNIKKVCPSMRPGRQEDAHEFLRYAIDNLQDANLRTHGKTKATPAVKETTLIHKSFGGKLRSRVRCSVCNHDSDTFDTFMDLSVDIGNGAQDLETCLKRIAQTDRLFGKNKYKCEKCKKLVDAEKTVRIVRLPPILSVHLKRFTPTGRKINGEIGYPEHLQIPNKAVDGVSATYELYGVVCHQGSGPHLGHYYSLIRGSDNTWQEMNDESVSRTRFRDRNAYILHYVKAPGSKLESAINDAAKSAKPATHSPRPISKLSTPNDQDVGLPVRAPWLPIPEPVAGPSNYQTQGQASNHNNGRKSSAFESDQEANDQPSESNSGRGDRNKKIRLEPRPPGVAYESPPNHRNARSDYAPRSNGDIGLPTQFTGKNNRLGRGRGGSNQSPFNVGGGSGKAGAGGFDKHRGKKAKAKDRMQKRQGPR